MKVFITGGLSGLGLELSHRFLDDGHRVGVCDLMTEDRAASLLRTGIRYYRADVLDRERMRDVTGLFTSENEGIDIVVANAGISMPKARIPDFDRGRKVIGVNVIGVLNTFEPAIGIMKEQGSGQLVALGSVAGRVGLPGMAMYGASKAAVIHLCESLEMDLAGFGIQVTTLAPGFIETPLTEGLPHRMPFRIPQSKAVSLMYRAILKRKGLYIFPFRMRMLSGLLYHLPRSIYKYLLGKDPLGLAKH